MEITKEMVDAALAATDFAIGPVSRRWMKNALVAALRHAEQAKSAPAPDDKPFTFADPRSQAEWERQRREGR